MLESILKIAEKWGPGCLGLAGIYFTFVSLCTNLPSSSNGFVPSFRNPPEHRVLVVGLAFVVVSSGLLVLNAIRSNTDERKRVKTENPPPVESVGHSPETAIALSEAQTAMDVVTKFYMLSATQKEIVLAFYSGFEERLPLAQLLTVLLHKQGPRMLGSADAELYYRLKDLQLKGFVRLARIGQKQSEIIKVESIRKGLLSAGLVDS